MRTLKVSTSIIFLMSVCIYSYAEEAGEFQQSSGQVVESAANKLFYTPFNRLAPSANSQETDMSFCKADNSALVTIYSENGMARSSIDVKVDGSQVGSLRSYFPDGAPGCKSPSARGIITIKVPAGRHTLEATSPNLNWPQRKFSVQECECLLLPLS